MSAKPQIWRHPNWLKRHKKHGYPLDLLILSVEDWGHNRATVCAMPSRAVLPSDKHPARIRLVRTGTHWRIEGRGVITTRSTERA